MPRAIAMLYVIHVWQRSPTTRVGALGTNGFSIAVRAKPRGAARPCSHSCSVRFEICNFNAASLCERLFRSRQARSLRGNAPAVNL